MDSLPLIEILIVLAFIIVAAVAVKIGITFNFNEWGKNRRKILKSKLKAACPHTIIEFQNDGKRIEISSLFTSPSGTVNWICSRCGTHTINQNLPDKLMHHYRDNADQYIKDTKKFNKLYKRLYG